MRASRMASAVRSVRCTAVPSRRVALIEDEVEDVQDHAKALGPLRLRRQVESHARGSDALLGPADALGHRGFRHQECVRNLRGRQPADGPQR